VLDTFEILQCAVIPMLILDRSHEQGVNPFRAGGWISSSGGALAASLRPRARSAGPRRQGDQAHSQRRDVFYVTHAFAWRCQL
jgi:hypothetical protein